jgi:O-succinylbenzoate synthase
MAQKKQVEKLKKPVNESLQESRRVEIVREAMKDAKIRDDKKRKDGEVKGKKDAFEPNPTLTSQIVKTSS